MPSVSLPPKENALFKRILVSGGREGGQAAPRGRRPCAALRRAAAASAPPGGPPRASPAADRSSPPARPPSWLFGAQIVALGVAPVWRGEGGLSRRK